MRQSSGQFTRSYRFYFLDGSGLIARAYDIEASSDAEACERAVLMLDEQSDFPGIEVWDRARKVQRFPLPVSAGDDFRPLYRTTAQRLRRMAEAAATPLGGKLLALSREIDDHADKLDANRHA